MNHLQLFSNIKSKRSFLCVGLDPEIEKIPTFLSKKMIRFSVLIKE